MDIKGFMDKAKGAAAAATDMAKEVATAASEQAKAALASPAAAPGTEVAPLNGAGEVSADGAPGKTVANVTNDTLSSLRELGTTKLQELVTSFQQALPAIKTAGYELTEFEIELGVPPKLIPHFRYVAKTSEDVDRAREAVRENKLGSLILTGLLKAGEVHKQIKVAGYSFSHVEIELGLIPSVRLQYKNELPG